MANPPKRFGATEIRREWISEKTVIFSEDDFEQKKI